MTKLANKRLIGSVASALGATFAGVCAAIYMRSFGSGFQEEDRQRLATPGDFGLKYEQLHAATSDGVPILAWYLPGKRDAVIVISGGYRGRAWDVMGMAVALRKAGFHVVMYGWRGTPGSGKHPHTLGAAERRDLAAVLQSVRERVGDLPVGLLGYSLGGSVSISVGARDPEIFAVCSDSAFKDPVQLLAFRIRRAFRLPGTSVLVQPVVRLLRNRTGEDLRTFSPIRVVSHIAPRPLFVIHGEADTVVPARDAFALYEAALEPKSLWVLPTTGHVGAYFMFRQQYIERVVAFFEAALQGQQWECYDVPASAAVEHVSGSKQQEVREEMPSLSPDTAS